MFGMVKLEPGGMFLKDIASPFDRAGFAKFANNGHGVLVFHNTGKKTATVKIQRDPKTVEIKLPPGTVVVAGKFPPPIFNKGTGQLCLHCATGKEILVGLIF